MSTYIKYNLLSSGEVEPIILESDFYVNSSTDIEYLEQQINLNHVTPRFRIYVLHADETINYEIPSENIKAGGSYSENYQNGQRRSLSFTLWNENKQYSPNIDTLWAGTRLRFDIGITVGVETLWFVKGYFIITKASPSLTPSGKEVAISASDKFALFDGTLGRLADTYEITEGTDIREVIENIKTLELGDGSIRDTKPIFYHEKFENKTVQVSIVKNAGETFSDILLELATQLSAEIFYSATGNLTIVPITDVTQDKNKSVLYSFNDTDGDMSQLNFDYDYNSIINRVVVLGNSQNGGVYRGVAVNNDERSPLCYQRIGYRTDNIINDSNIYSDILAGERAEYELRQKLILKSSVSFSVLFNPFLTVNNLISINSEFYNLVNEKFLIQSISFGLDFSGQMNLTISNIQNLATNIEVKHGFQ